MEKVYLGFKLNHKTFGLEAKDVLRVSQIVEITPVPQASETIMGIINVMGEVVPVVDLRKQLNFPARSISYSDYLIIVRTNDQSLSFVVDEIIGLIPAFDNTDVMLKNIIQNSTVIERVIKQRDEFILIINSRELLNKQEFQQNQKMVETLNDGIYPTYRKATA